MAQTRILVIEDEEDIVSLVKLQGEIEGYKMLAAMDGLNGYLTAEKEKPDLIILDIMLPGLNGLDVCRKLKSNEKLKEIPIIMLSAKSEELDIVLGLELGADDYVTKPFSPKILFTRIKAVLRRKEEPKTKTKTIVFGSYHIDLESYQVKKKDKIIPLTLSEFGILQRLVQSKGKVLTRNQLLDTIAAEEGGYIVDRNIDVHVASLRKKLGPNFDYIKTVRGVGYRFEEE